MASLYEIFVWSSQVFSQEIIAKNQQEAELRQQQFSRPSDDDVDDGHSLLHNYLYHKYVRFRDRALEQRRITGAGNSRLVASLFDFWVERLLHKFNRNMYATFKELALLDASEGSRYGGW